MLLEFYVILIQGVISQVGIPQSEWSINQDITFWPVVLLNLLLVYHVMNMSIMILNKGFYIAYNQIKLSIK